MAKTDLTINSYHSLESLDKSIRAFVELVHVLPEDDRFVPLLMVLSDRIEGDFVAMRQDAISLWREPVRDVDALG